MSDSRKKLGVFSQKGGEIRDDQESAMEKAELATVYPLAEGDDCEIIS